jgi:hypothetical protein
MDEHVGLGGGRLDEEPLPFSHQPAALLEQVAAPVGLFDLVGDGVGERLLDDVIRPLHPGRRGQRRGSRPAAARR